MILLAVIAALSWAQSPLALPALASGTPPMMPAVGDTLTYVVSTGERVTFHTTRVSQLGDRVVATDAETVSRAGGRVSQAAVHVIRTADALAFELPVVAGESLSPLVYFFAPANPNDSWLAQKVSYVDASGHQVNYQVLAKVDGIETVTAPAGTFNDCWRVTFFASSDPADRLVVWLDPALGIVRTRSRYHGKTIVTELTSFALARAN